MSPTGAAFHTFGGWAQTLFSAIHLLTEAKPVTQSDDLKTLTGIIISQAANFGPSPRTGGHLHAVSAEKAELIAAAVLHYAPLYGLEPAFVVAGLSGESRCDDQAVNPNWQDGKPGETPYETFLHTDIGIAQFDGATLIAAEGIFADLKGLSWEQIQTNAFDYDWAIQHFCAFVAKLISDTKAEVAANPKLLDNVRNGSLDVFATEAYNAGEHGAEEMVEAHKDLSYGERWVTNFHTYDAIMKGKK